MAASATSTVVPGLTNGTTYRFRVTATNAVGTGPSSTATPGIIAPFAALAAFVQRQSLDLRGVPATSAEQGAAVAALNAGTTTPAAHIVGLRAGSDATTRVDPTARLYFAYFRRVPDAAGLDYWLAQRRGGRSLQSISDYFRRSGEFVTLYGTLTNRQFVELIYTNILGRPGEPSGVTYWTGELDSGRRTRGSVMIGFSESPEYRAKMRAAVDVAVTWIAMLGAKPDAATFDTWVTALTTGGQTVTDLAAALLADRRYATRVT